MKISSDVKTEHYVRPKYLKLDLLSKLTKLQFLTLDHCTDRIDELFNLPSLTELTIDSTSTTQTSINTSNDDIRNIGKAKNLEKLSLTNTQNITAPGLKYIASLDKLTSLSLSSNFNIHNVSILTKVKSLTSLNIAGCQHMTDKDFESVAQLTSLTSLEISYSEVTPKSFNRICTMTNHTVLKYGR